jgi:hypothetical protein
MTRRQYSYNTGPMRTWPSSTGRLPGPAYHAVDPKPGGSGNISGHWSLFQYSSRNPKPCQYIVIGLTGVG